MSKISSNILKLGRKTAEDISLTIDNGTATLPEIKYDNAAGNFKFSNDGTNFFDFGSGSGSGEINYIDNWDFETDTSGWATYADAAGTTPVDGDGGSPNVAISAQATTVLRGGKSLKLVKDAVDRQGEGFSYDFSIKEQDIQKKLKIQFDFKTDEDAAYANGDLTVYIYDVTNAALITPVDTDIISGQNIFQTSFVSTASTSYRLIFHIATTNASAWDAYIDNVIVGPGMTSQGAAVGGWTAYTPSNTQGFGTITSDNIEYRRVGDGIELRGYFTIGTVAASEAQIGLPNGLSIGGVGSNTIIVGDYARDVVSATGAIGKTLATATDSFINFSIVDIRDGLTKNATAPVTGLAGFGNTERISFFATGIPITQWAGSGIVPMLAEDNLSQWTPFTVGSSWTTATTHVAWYRRVGDSMELRGSVQLSGAPDSATLTIQIPNNLNIETSLINPSISNFGHGVARDVTGASAQVYANYAGISTEFRFIWNRDASGPAPITQISPWTWASGDDIRWNATVPIAEWAGSQNSLVGYSLADGNNAGLLPSVTNMSDAIATQLGLKVYEAGTDFTIAAQGGGTISSSNGYAIPKQTQNGDWVLFFSVDITLTGGSTAFNFSLSGIDHDYNNFGGDQACNNGKGDATETRTFTSGGVNHFRYVGSSQTEIIMSGNIRLDSKPTWAV